MLACWIRNNRSDIDMLLAGSPYRKHIMEFIQIYRLRNSNEFLIIASKYDIEENIFGDDYEELKQTEIVIDVPAIEEEKCT